MVMKQNILKYCLIFVLVVTILSILIFIYLFTNSTRNKESVQSKVKQEISYLDMRITSIVNSLNNLETESVIKINEISVQDPKKEESGQERSGGENQKQNSSKQSNNSTTGNQQSEESTNDNEMIQTTSIKKGSILNRDRNEIDWEYIYIMLEELSQSWSVIAIDLKSMDISNDDLLVFSSSIDSAFSYAKIEDKTNTLITLANLYQEIPKYATYSSEKNETIELKKIKADLISSYSLIDTGRWSEMVSLLNDAENRITQLINAGNNTQNIQKYYIQLKEYIKSVNEMDVELCYVKYYYFIKELEKEEI